MIGGPCIIIIQRRKPDSNAKPHLGICLSKSDDNFPVSSYKKHTSSLLAHVIFLQ